MGMPIKMPSFVAIMAANISSSAATRITWPDPRLRIVIGSAGSSPTR